MKKSIRKKINKLIIFSMVTLSVFTVGANLIITSIYSIFNSETILHKSCSTQSLRLNDTIKQVEQSVESIYELSEMVRPSTKELESVERTQEFIRQFQDYALIIADNTEGATALYYRMNPELNGDGTQGFYFNKTIENEQFEYTPNTDLCAYSPEDEEFVGWYYEPVHAGKAIWMDPYHNANTNRKIISYVIPIFDEDQFLIGVIGMDINFDMILDIAEDVDIYSSSGASLVSMTTHKNFYHNCSMLGDRIPDTLYEQISGASHSENLINYHANRTDYKLYYETLENGLKLLIYTKSSEINQQGTASLVICSVVFVVIFALTLIFAMRMSKRITDPIENITNAAKRFAEGDWDATVTCESNDELKVLTDNITIMASKTKEYINFVDDMAKKDGLTQLRNKTAYLNYIERLKADYELFDKNFAVILFDVNNLKVINDTLGHEKGDELIINASRYICNVFSHSPIFRIGGDEFIAILDSEDFQNREHLMSQFQAHMAETAKIIDINEVCIASGIAVYKTDANDYDALFEIADQRMYENKTRLKGGEAPR